MDYADLEMRLGNIDRCRTIYSKFLEAKAALFLMKTYAKPIRNLPKTYQKPMRDL